MIISPTNKIIVQVKHKYIANITDLLRRSSIQNNASVDPTDYVNIVGTVVSLPKVVNDRFGLEGFTANDIQVGDLAIFSHSVIYDFIEQAEGQPPVYKNMIWHEGNEYFMADISLIYGVIRDGEIIMINGYVMIKPFQESKIILAAGSRNAKNIAHCQVMHVGNPLGNRDNLNMKQGDWVYFNPSTAMKYQINSKPFVIVPQENIFGVDCV